MRGFLQQLFANFVDGRSVARKLSALRHLYRFLLLDKRVDRDPTLNIPTPKQWKVLPKSLARDEVEQMLAHGATGVLAGRARDNKNTGVLVLRNRAMLEVFYAGALRVSEIVSLKLEDVKLEMGYVLVRGKGDKERIVPLGRSAQEALSAYFREARPKLAAGKSSPLLFIARGVKKLTRQRVWQIVGLASASTGRHASPHMLRHSCATHRANHPRPRRHFDHAGLYPRRFGPVEECLCETSSEGKSAMNAIASREREEKRGHGFTRIYTDHEKQEGFIRVDPCKSAAKYLCFSLCPRREG